MQSTYCIIAISIKLTETQIALSMVCVLLIMAGHCNALRVPCGPIMANKARTGDVEFIILGEKHE